MIKHNLFTATDWSGPAENFSYLPRKLASRMYIAGRNYNELLSHVSVLGASSGLSLHDRNGGDALACSYKIVPSQEFGI